jgi:hypothetical protein
MTWLQSRHATPRHAGVACIVLALLSSQLRVEVLPVQESSLAFSLSLSLSLCLLELPINKLRIFESRFTLQRPGLQTK